MHVHELITDVWWQRTIRIISDSKIIKQTTLEKGKYVWQDLVEETRAEKSF